MVEAPIDRVRVYHQGATVTRRLVVSAPVPAELEFGGLPLAVLDETVRVRCLGSGTTATGLRIGLHARGPDELPADPDREALRALERRISVERDRMGQIDLECARLGSLQVPARARGKEGRPPPPSPMRARVALEQFTDTAIEERLAERAELVDQLSVLEEQRRDLEDAILRASSAKRAASHRITKTVRAQIAGSSKGEVVFELDYFVPGARWVPQYRLDIARDGSSATLSLRALLCQDSGEDWRGVKLELSTAIPMQFTELPTLSSIRIGRHQPAPATRGYRAPPQGAEVLFGDFDRDRSFAQSMLPAAPKFAGPGLSISPAEPTPVAYGATMDSLKEIRFDEDEESALDDVMRGAAAPMPPPAAESAAEVPKPAMRRSKAKAKKLGGLRRERTGSTGGGGSNAAPGVAAQFAQLTLGAAEGRSRGRLTPVERRDLYLERLEETGLVVDFDVVERVEAAVARAAAAAGLPLPAGTTAVRGAAGQFDYAYRAEDRVDVPSDRAFHSVPLGTRQTPCSLSYVVVPREDLSVFRMAKITNADASPLLPGPAEVYVDGEYVLTTTMPMVAPSARFELGLGVEQAIRAVRNTRYRESRSGKAVVAMAELEHAIEIELANSLPREIPCEVRERIPQPAPDAEVDVEEVGVEPPWEVWDQTHAKGPELIGGRRWKVMVPAGGETKLLAKYIVKIYANNEIAGGNRREA